MARWAFDDNVPRVRPRLRLGRTVEEEAATEAPPVRTRSGKASGDRSRDDRAPEAKAREAVEPAIDEDVESVETTETTEATDAVKAAEAAEAAEDTAPVSEPRARRPSKAAIRSLIGAPQSAPGIEEEPAAEEAQADEAAIGAAAIETAAVEEEAAGTAQDEAEAAAAVAPEPIEAPVGTVEAIEAIDAFAEAEAAAGSVEEAPPTPEPGVRSAPETTTAEAPRTTAEQAPRPDPEAAFEAATRRSDIKRRAAGLGAFVETSPEVSLFDDLDPVSAAAELAAELERALAEAQEANEQFRRDLSLALDDLARATAEVKRLTERNARLETEAKERTQVVQDLVREMELLESERDGAFARGSDAAMEMESLREKLEFGERRVRELERQVADAQARSRRLEEANAAQSAQRAALRAEVASLRRERDELLGRNAELERERDELARSKQALDEIHRALAEARQRAQRIRTR